MSKLLEALSKLDVNNDAHWTSDGLPRLETLKILASDQSITRETINKISPGFNRYSQPAASTNDVVVEEVIQVETNDDHVEGLEDEDSEGKSETEQKLDAAQKQVDALCEERDKIAAMLQIACRERDLLAEEYHSQRGKEPAGVAIRSYLDSQRQLLQQRAEKMKTISESGINLRDWLPQKAPIDQAMQRRTSRGTSRPKY
jgi:hypothetical protein